MKQLITACVKRPVTAASALIALALAAVLGGASLPLTRLPEISLGRLIVETAYPGMSAEEVRALVTIPVEDALAPVKGLERIRSVSRAGVSIITLDFRWGTPAAAAAVLVREAVDSAYSTLPDGAEKPRVSTASVDEEPHCILAVVSKEADAVFERRFAGYELRARLRGIDGVGAILVSGGQIPEAQVELDMHKAAGRGIDGVELARLLAAETRDLPAGSAREGDSEIQVISKGSVDSCRALSGLVLPAAVPLKIADIAAVRAVRAPQKSIFVVNGVEQTAVEVYRRPGANPERLSAELRRLAAEVNTRFSRDIELSVVFDAAPRITRALHGLAAAMLISAAAVIAVLFLFIRNIRLSLLAALSIAVSACAALVTLRAAGASLNAMSLAGLSLGLGLVSDTALIIIDALARAFPASSRRPAAAEVAAEAAALSASSFGGAATTAVVFIPVLFLPGPLGALFGELSLAIAASVLAGWLYAQFVLPSLFLAGFGTGGGKAAQPQPAAARAQARYVRLLAFTFRRPALVLAAAALFSAAGAALALSRPLLFIGKDSAAEVNAVIVFPAGTRAAFIAAEAASLTAALSALDSFTTVFASAGAENDDLQKRARAGYEDEKLMIRALLQKAAAPEAARARFCAVLDSWNRAASRNLNAQVFFPPEPVEEILGLFSGARFAVRGGNSAEAGRAARSAAEKLRATGLFTAVHIEPDGLRDEYRIYPRRERAAAAGVDALAIARQAAQASEGFIAGRLETPAYPIDIRVRGGGAGSAAALASLPITAAGKGVVPLGSLAAVVREKTERALARLDRADTRYLTAVQKDGEKTGRRAQKAVEELQKTMPQVSPVDRSAFSRYQNALVLTFALVLLLLYLALTAQFESWTLPVIFLLSIPFALAGVGPALAITRLPLDSGSVIALVALFGVVVNNGIVLYERAAAKCEEGLEPEAAALEGAGERLLPVLATTLTTTLVLIAPAAAALGAAQKTMSVTMLGGCLASTFITLFALPAVFARFLRRRYG